MEVEKIYSLYFKDVYRYIRKLSGDEHIAEEIAADTFFKAMKVLDSFRGECDIRVWLCQIAKNCYLSYLKKYERSDTITDDVLFHIKDSRTNIEEDVIRQDEAYQIKKILHDIEEPYKEVFMWRVFCDLNFKQIGQIFGKSENWACVTYHRARSKIKERLEAAENEK